MAITKLKMDGKIWEELGNLGQRPANIPVKIGDYWAVSPDGLGSYYYDTLEQLQDDYLDLDN